jgi:pSer/pThr/pTyr-binding forkhead associated (FHA) protein
VQDRSGSRLASSRRAPAAARSARWVLVALGGGDLRTHPLAAGGEFLLGRDLDCDIVLAHHRVSRRHARLRVAGAGDALAIEDLGSRNGTRVGEGLRPNQPCPVRAGDVIGIGPFTLTAVRGAVQPRASLVVEDPLASAPSAELLVVARSPGRVLVRGDAGAGASSRVLAEALHRLSGRGGRFASLDCAALTPDALERELESAGPGTLLLEEVGALPPPLQARLLLAVEGRELAARLVCATQRDLLASIEAGAFRLDLYYRLAGATLRIRRSRATLSRPPRARR